MIKPTLLPRPSLLFSSCSSALYHTFSSPQPPFPINTRRNDHHQTLSRTTCWSQDQGPPAASGGPSSTTSSRPAAPSGEAAVDRPVALDNNGKMPLFIPLTPHSIHGEKHLLIMAFVRCSAPRWLSSQRCCGLSPRARPVAPPPSKPVSIARRWCRSGRRSRTGGLGEGWPGCMIGSTGLEADFLTTGAFAVQYVQDLFGTMKP